MNMRFALLTADSPFLNIDEVETVLSGQSAHMESVIPAAPLPGKLKIFKNPIDK